MDQILIFIGCTYFFTSFFELQKLMKLFFFLNNINLFQQNAAALAQLGPGHIGPPPKKYKEVSTAYMKKKSKDIWSEEEVAEGSQYDDLTDPRPQPEYEIILKQSVKTEDLFLGLSRKDPSSMCCEAMLVNC
uniref:Dynein axonemal assembly factor 6 n=1 Tax=Acanthochromis polyacanthus TaxID=80966 RepID=A0A3Q1FE59_9TELE